MLKDEQPSQSREERRRLVASRSLRLFARMGFSKVSFQDISKATGVPRTALYRCYRTKREIFDDAIGRALAELRTIVNATLAEPASAADRLEKVCGIVAERLFEQRDFLSAIFNFVSSMVTAGEDMSARIEGFTGGLRRAFRKLLAAGIEDGSIRSSVNPEASAELLFSLMEAVAFNILLDLEKDSRRARRRFREAITSIRS